MPSELMNGTTAQALNGLTAKEIAVSGCRVIARCEPELATDLTIWSVIAEKAIRFVEDSKRRAEEVSAAEFANMIFAMSVGGTGDWDSLTEKARHAFEAVARLWYGMIGAEIRTDAQAHEDNAVRWHQRKHPQQKERITTNAPVERPVTAGDARSVAVVTIEPPSVVPSASPRQSLAPGFRAILDRRIAELEHTAKESQEKADALKTLAAVIGPEHDEALWEVFGSILQGEK